MLSPLLVDTFEIGVPQEVRTTGKARGASPLFLHSIGFCRHTGGHNRSNLCMNHGIADKSVRVTLLAKTWFH